MIQRVTLQNKIPINDYHILMNIIRMTTFPYVNTPLIIRSNINLVKYKYLDCICIKVVNLSILKLHIGMYTIHKIIGE